MKQNNVFKTMLSLFILILFTSTSYAQVYKCKDENGKIKYSDKPCEHQAQEVSNKSYSGNSISSNNASETTTITGGLSNSYCQQSVKNGKDWIASMRDVGTRNQSGGFVSQQEYATVMKELGKVEKFLTSANCQSATGVQKGFFQCLNKGSNHIVTCARENEFDI